MKILTVAYPFAPVSADSVGGAEQIAFQLVQALPGSTLIAREDSKTSAQLLPLLIPKGPLNDPSVRAEIYDQVRDYIAATDADLIHFHGIDFNEYLPRDSETPCLVTLHLPPDWYPDLNGDNLHFNCVSESQLQRCPPGFEACVIPNGIPMPSFRVCPKPRDFVFCLGRICPEKGFHLALDAAAQVNVPFILAGEVFPYESHERYFREQILPRLSGTRRFIGAVGRARKYRLMAAARCVLVPSTVHETSSLVAMEAMACGAPAVAFRRGALATLIKHGCNGILVDHEAELPGAIRDAHHIDRNYCRAFARAQFSSETMIARYLDLYQTICSRNTRTSVRSHFALSAR